MTAALDFAARLCHPRAMTIARISELDRKTTQSGKANTGRWLLEFERQQPLRPDPLTGWNGRATPTRRSGMTFETKDDAIAYCEKQGLRLSLVPAAAGEAEDPGLRRQFPLDACQPNAEPPQVAPPS